MRQNSLISSIWKSFYSKDLYQDICHNWGFSVVGYLFLLIIIYMGFVSYNHGSSFHNTFNLTLNEFVAQLPTGEVAQGKMTIKEHSPYEMGFYPDIVNTTLPKKTLVVFDMNNQITPANTTATVIFHSNGYYFITEQKTNAPLVQAKKIKSVDEPGAKNAYQFKPYPAKAHFRFSKQQAQQWASEVKWILPFMLILFIGIGQFIFKLVQAIIYAFLALVFSVFCKVKLTYGQAYSLSIVAMTPAFFLISIAAFFLDIRHAWFIAFIIEAAYLFFAVYANRPNHLPKSY